MTATTANFALRYPTAGDRPCDGAEQIKNLRDDIYGYLDTYLTQMQRQRALPVVAVTYSGTLTFNQFIPWTSVEQDDVEAVDLVLQRNAIFLGNDSHPDRVGTYMYGIDITYNETDFAFACSIVDVILTPNTHDARAYDVTGTSMNFAIEIPALPTWLGNSALLHVPAETMVQGRSTCFGNNAFARMWAIRIGEP